MSKITTIDRPTIRRLREEMETALGAFEDANGVKVRFGSASFDSGQVTFKVTVATVSESGVAMTPEATALEVYKFRHGIEDAYGKRFTSRGDTYELVGYKPKSPKYPFLGRNVVTGKVFKFTPFAVESLKSINV